MSVRHGVNTRTTPSEKISIAARGTQELGDRTIEHSEFLCAWRPVRVRWCGPRPAGPPRLPGCLRPGRDGKETTELPVLDRYLRRRPARAKMWCRAARLSISDVRRNGHGDALGQLSGWAAMPARSSNSCMTCVRSAGLRAAAAASRVSSNASSRSGSGSLGSAAASRCRFGLSSCSSSATRSGGSQGVRRARTTAPMALRCGSACRRVPAVSVGRPGPTPACAGADRRRTGAVLRVGCVP